MDHILKRQGCTVIHVVSSVTFALNAIEAGVDGIVAEGFEAGGHNGREETTTMTLLPLVRKSISVPLIAAGGIATGEAMLAAFALGAEAVQVGSRFVTSLEASCHEAFKKKVIDSGEEVQSLRSKNLLLFACLRTRFMNK